MDTLDIEDAKRQFPRVIQRVEKGETIIISRAGKPVAKLEPFEAKNEQGLNDEVRGS